MPVHTLDGSTYTSIKKTVVTNQVSNSLNSAKLRAPLTYGSYAAFSRKNLSESIFTYAEPSDVVILDFLSPQAGYSDGNLFSFYVEYAIPSPTTTLNFRYTNLTAPAAVFPEIDSATFDFDSDQTSILRNRNPVNLNVSYTSPNFSTYGVSEYATALKNRDIVSIVTNTPISGTLYVGYYYNI